jgi:hypothetical protein
LSHVDEPAHLPVCSRQCAVVRISWALWWNGYLAPVFQTDLSRVTFAIAALFVLGWLGMAKEIVIASRQLNFAKAGPLAPARESERDKDLAKVEWLASVSEWLVGLGLVGTVIGFIIALSSVDQSALLQASGAQSAVATLMQGMRTALNTTVLGASLGDVARGQSADAQDGARRLLGRPHGGGPAGAGIGRCRAA